VQLDHGVLLVIGEIVTGIIEGVAAMVQLVAESLGFAASRLTAEIAPGESRWNGKRVLIAFGPLVLVVTGLVGFFWYLDWREEVRRAQREQTRAEVENWVDKLTGQVDEEGRLVRHPRRELEARDAWGEPLLVDYHQTALGEAVTVRSKGPDKTEQTWDDIKIRGDSVQPKKVGRTVLRGLGKKIKNRLQRDNGAED
jgi:hypothetical protein